MQRPAPTTHRAGFAYLAGSVLAYGVGWPVLRIGSHLMQPLWFGTARLVIASMTMFMVLGLTGRFRWPARADLPAILSVGVCMLGLYAVFAQIALAHIGAGRGSLLGYTTPLWVTPVAVFVLGERMTHLKALGFTLGLGGLVVLFNPLQFEWSDREAVFGNGLCLAAALSWSIAILQIRTHRYRLTSLELAPWQMFTGAVVCFIAFLVFEGRQEFTWTLDAVLVLSFAGPIASGAAVFFTTSAMRLLPSLTISIWLLGVPLLSIMISVLFLGEQLTASLAAGLALILSGLAAMAVAEARRR